MTSEAEAPPGPIRATGAPWVDCFALQGMQSQMLVAEQTPMKWVPVQARVKVSDISMLMRHNAHVTQVVVAGIPGPFIGSFEEWSGVLEDAPAIRET